MDIAVRGDPEGRVMRFVISYDITEDRPCTKVAKLMEEVLNRVQYSVFEGDAPEEKVMGAVDRALGLIDPEADSLRGYRLCRTCVARIDSYGKPVGLSEGEVTVL
jgi:CRISPR-associated protein Cas2